MTIIKARSMNTSRTNPEAYLFVYGTLMRASSHPMARRLRAASRFVAQGSMPGRLYSLGRFPGIVEDPSGRSRVFGDVLQLVNPSRDFIWLDEYEGCGPDFPEPQIYKRKRLPVTLDSGRELCAWVYIYNWTVNRARMIPGGRFLPV